MVDYNNPFVYGPNLTKYCHRAMSRANGICVLTAGKTIGGSEITVSYGNHKAIHGFLGEGITQFCAPIVFRPKKYFDQVENEENIESLEALFIPGFS